MAFFGAHGPIALHFMSSISCTSELPVGYFHAPWPIRLSLPMFLPTSVVMLKFMVTLLSGAESGSSAGSTYALMPSLCFFAFTISLQTLPIFLKALISLSVICRMPNTSTLSSATAPSKATEADMAHLRWASLPSISAEGSASA